MSVTHVLYAKPEGSVREEVVHLLNENSIDYVLLDWFPTDPVHSFEQVSLVTSVGEFSSVASIRLYVQQHHKLADIANRFGRSL